MLVLQKCSGKLFFLINTNKSVAIEKLINAEESNATTTLLRNAVTCSVAMATHFLIQDRHLVPALIRGTHLGQGGMGHELLI